MATCQTWVGCMLVTAAAPCHYSNMPLPLVIVGKQLLTSLVSRLPAAPGSRRPVPGGASAERFQNRTVPSAAHVAQRDGCCCCC